jgi:hypothetical protein
MSKAKSGQQGQVVGVGGTAGVNQPKQKTSDASKLEAPNKLHSGVRVRQGEQVTIVAPDKNKGAAIKAAQRQITDAKGIENGNPKRRT